MQISTRFVRRLISVVALAGALSPLPLRAQDAGLVLSTSVGYNTQRAALTLTPEQAKEAERLGREATRASAAGKYGEALNDMAKGLAVMRGVAWTPEVEFASALRGKLDHTMVAPGRVTVTLAPLYATKYAAAANLKAEVTLRMRQRQAITLALDRPVDIRREQHPIVLVGLQQESLGV